MPVTGSGGGCSLSTSDVYLYACDARDYEIAVAAAILSGVPESNVIGDFETAWNLVTNGSTNAVFAVGGPSLDALYYNPNGWSNPLNEAAGSTPFAKVDSAVCNAPGNDYFINAAGTSGADTFYLAVAFAYFALNGSFPAEFPSPPTPAAPSSAKLTRGTPTQGCPCNGNFYGGDSCAYYSVSCGSYDFYGKPTGYGVTPSPACNCTTCSSNAASIYSLWTLQGPGDKGSYTNSEWGTQQAAAAISNLPSDVNGKTIFFDVESASGGWGTDQTANQEVLEAALSRIASDSSGVNPGIYISIGSTDNKWNYYFGSSYKPSTPFVLWAALHECYSCSEAQSEWPNYYSSSPIHAGGQEVVIAQYYIAACNGTSPADLDYMRQDPKNLQFQPVSY